MASPLSGIPGLLASMHAVPHCPVLSSESSVAGTSSVVPPPMGPPSLHSLSIHLDLPMAQLNIAPTTMTVPTAATHSSSMLGPTQPPVVVEFTPTPGPSEPGQGSASQVLETPDHADGG